MKHKGLLIGMGVVVFLVFLYFLVWQSGLLLRISPPILPQDEISVTVSTQPAEIAPPKTGVTPTIGIVRYGPPWWAWAALALVAIAYSGTVGYFFGEKAGKRSKK
ncbi:MAG: hypothetical protein QMD88_07700 [Coprothermobacterota bacterium]|nr:hypothetical protein [Coprothermobacterota bacterium]